MTGYSPAHNLHLLSEPKNMNWFWRWIERRRHRKAQKRRARMKFLAALTLPDHQKSEFFQFIDNMSDHDVLCKAGQERG